LNCQPGGLLCQSLAGCGRGLVMKDALGRYLRNRRICAVLPYITGRLLDIACGTNALVRAYDGQGLGTDVYQWGDVDLIV